MSDLKEKKYLSISAFSKLSGISRKNLIFYDNIGLLKPARIMENGYRYYSYSQIEEVSIIYALKDLGVPLEEIKKYMENISPENLILLISKQKQKILKELNRLSQMNYIIEQRIACVPVLNKINCNEIILEAGIEEPLFTSQEQKFDVNSFDRDFDNFLIYSNSRNLIYGYQLGVYADFKDIVLNRLTTYRFFLRIDPNTDVEKIVKPAGLYAITYDNSYLAENIEIFRKLDSFISQSGYRACGNVYIENISDEVISKNPDTYYSKISVRVEKD